MSRGIWILHNQDLLDNPPKVPAAGLHPQGEVQSRRSRGTGPSQSEQETYLSEG